MWGLAHQFLVWLVLGKRAARKWISIVALLHIWVQRTVESNRLQNVFAGKKVSDMAGREGAKIRTWRGRRRQT